MSALGRHPNLLIGSLLAVVAVLVIVAAVGLGTAATPLPTEPIALGSAPAPAVTPMPTPSPVVSAPDKDPVALESPSTFEIEPGVMTDCGRIERVACEQAITLAKTGEGDIVGTTLMPFDAIVVFVTAGGDTTGWYPYHVVATDTSVPQKAERWQDDIPSHIVDRIRAALATP